MTNLFSTASFPIERLNFNLTYESPLLAFNKLYEEILPTVFDMHYELEIGIIYSGKAIRKYQTCEIEMGPGQIWFGGVWEPQGFQICETPCDVFSFVIYPEFLVQLEPFGFNWFELFSMKPENRPQVPQKNRKVILDLCDKLRDIFESGNSNDLLWKKVIFLNILCHIIDGNDSVLSTKPNSEQKYYSYIQPALQLVFTSKKYIHLTNAAKACSMSTSNFSRIFKELMGIPFSKFALRHRIKQAAQQLVNTDDLLKSIAAEWNFTDTSHFYNCFISHYKISPNEYRKIHQGCNPY